MEANINLQRKIGIEIECVVPIIGAGDNRDVQNLLASVLTNQGIQASARSCTQRPVPSGCKMTVEHDTSLRDESRFAGLSWSKIECKTMPMSWSQVEEILPQALEIIRYCGARVNYSCGLHVHHHLPEVAEKPAVVRSLWNLWWRYHRLMYGVTAPSRLSNTYCSAPQRSDASVFSNCRSHRGVCEIVRRLNRYNGLNLTNLANPDRQTVEWRLHAGTTDWQKIKAWVLATQRWVEHAVSRSCHFKPEPMPNSQTGLNSLLVTTGLKPNSRIYKVDKPLREVGRYLLKRWKHFNLPRDFKQAAAVA